MSADLERGLVLRLAGVAGGRIYPRLPQPATFPAIRYQRIATQRQQSLGGPVGVTEATVQVDCMALTYSDAKALADTARTALHGYTGAWGELVAHLVHLQSENDFSEEEGDNVTHWVSQRYQIWTDMD